VRKIALDIKDSYGNPIPRRAFLNRNTPAELAIRNAVQSVEEIGAHPLLTDAVLLLQQAFNKVADYIDQHIA
jgi:hypothetical protein